jgi:hypothetical protein
VKLYPQSNTDFTQSNVYRSFLLYLFSLKFVKLRFSKNSFFYFEN